MASGPHFGSQNGHHFGFKIRLKSDPERPGGLQDRPKSGRKPIGRGSKNGPKIGPPKKSMKIDFKAVLRPAERVLEVDPAKCEEPWGGL